MIKRMRRKGEKKRKGKYRKMIKGMRMTRGKKGKGEKKMMMIMKRLRKA